MAVYSGPEIVNNGLVLHLDAANSRSYPGSGTVWYDLSGNDKHASLINGTIYESTNNGGIVLDGGDELINIPNSKNLDYFGTGDFTVETFVKSNNVVYPRSRHPLQFFHTVTGAATRGWSVGHGASGSSVEIMASDGTNTQRTTLSHTAISESTYHHRIFTVSRAAGLLTTHYLNGKLVGQVNMPSVTGSIYNTASDAGTTGITFGYVWGWRYIGSVNVFRLYNRVLSTAEIQQNFEATRTRYGV